MAKKTINFDVGNEQVILSSMMKSKAVRIKLSSELKFTNFIGKRHKIIFKTLRAMAEMSYNEDTFDIIANGEEYGGTEYLRDLEQYFDINDNIDVHVKKLLKDSIKVSFKKRLIPELEEMLDDPATEIEDIQNLINDADSRIRANYNDNIVDSGESLKAKYKSTLHERAMGLKDVVGFGLDEIDEELVEGCQPGKVVIITARPSMGKTTFASNLVNHWTGKLDKKVLACPLETGSANLLDYIVVQRMNKKKQEISISEIMKYLKDTDIEKKHKISKMVDNVLDSEYLSVADSRELTLTRLRTILLNGDYDICVIDLFEKLADVTEENLSSKLEEVQKIAQDTKTCMVLVSQLRRFGGKVANKKPDMEQIKNSGKYEEVADLIVGLYREKYYNKELDDDILEVMILKQRNGLRDYSFGYRFLGSIATIGENMELESDNGW